MASRDTSNVISLFGTDINQWSDRFEIEQMKEILSDEEIERGNRFQFDQLRERFLWSRIFLRQVLSKMTGIAPREIRFGVGFNGKPFLESSGGTAGNFSFSRSGHFAVCCFTTGLRVGVDVEELKDINELSSMARTIFADEQYAQWDALQERQKQTVFYRAWTRKEAVAKIDGRGISNGLTGIDVPLEDLGKSQAAFVRLFETREGQTQVQPFSAVLSDWCPFEEVTGSVAFEANFSEVCDVEFCDQAVFAGTGGQSPWADLNFPIVSAQRQFSLPEKTYDI